MPVDNTMLYRWNVAFARDTGVPGGISTGSDRRVPFRRFRATPAFLPSPLGLRQNIGIEGGKHAWSEQEQQPSG